MKMLIFTEPDADGKSQGMLFDVPGIAGIVLPGDQMTIKHLGIEVTPTFLKMGEAQGLDEILKGV